VQSEAALWLLRASVYEIIYTISLIYFSSALKEIPLSFFIPVGERDLYCPLLLKIFKFFSSFYLFSGLFENCCKSFGSFGSQMLRFAQ
jgi:hypothetical protein